MPHRSIRPLLALVLTSGLLVASPTVRAAGDEPDIDAARAGLAAYLDVNRPESPTTSTNIPGCPAIGLDRLQHALGAVGIDDTIGGWATEIEWREYQRIDPDLMGITCGGDADGDPHDSDFEMSASVYAVDAGDADRAQDIIDELGFGALEFEPADVPGGELASFCADDPEQSLSMCMSFWSNDGFVLGVILASDVTDIPDGTARAVLEDTFDDIVATLGGVPAAPSGTIDASVDSTTPGTSSASTEVAGLDVAGARAGLAAVVDNAPDTGPNEPLSECPVVERAVMNGALETAGVDAPLGEWNLEVGPVDTGGPTWNDRGITCSGSYVGAEQDESFPELRASLLVVDLGESAAFERFLADAYPGATEPLPTPALGGATRGECADIDLTDQCVEFWEHDGFVVGVLLADRVFIDRPTASAILTELVPEVVDTLASDKIGASEGATAALDGATDEQLEAAISGLDALVGDATIRPIDFDACPALSEGDINESLGASDLTIDVDDWAGMSSVVPNDAGDDVIPGLMCRGSQGDANVQVFVNDFGNEASADEFIADLDGCENVADLQFCLAFGEREGFVVGVSILGPADDVTAGKTEAVLDGLVAIVLDNLAAVS